MPYTITDTIYAQLQADAKAFNDAVAALVPDTVDPAVLQHELTDANAKIVQLQAQVLQLTSDKQTLTTTNAALTAHAVTTGADIATLLADAQKASTDANTP